MTSVLRSCGGISRQHSQNWIQQRPKCKKNGDPHPSSSLKTNNLELRGLFCYFCSKEDWWVIQLRNAFLGWGQVPCVVSPTLVSLMGICRLWLCWAILWFGYAVMKLRTNTKCRSRHIQLTTHWRQAGYSLFCQARCWHIPPPNNSRTWISRLGSLGKNIMICASILGPRVQVSHWFGCIFSTRWIFHDWRFSIWGMSQKDLTHTAKQSMYDIFVCI